MWDDREKLVFLLLLLLFLTSCRSERVLTLNQERLALFFDENIDQEGFCINEETGYKYGLVGNWTRVIAGGILLDVKENLNDTYYILTFKGKNKTGDLFLYLDQDHTRKFEAGHFYTFDLMNNCKYLSVIVQSQYPPAVPSFMEPELLE